MKKNKIFLLAILLTGMGACKKNIQQQNLEMSAENYSLSQLGDTTIHKLMIDGNPTYVNEVQGKFFFSEDIEITPEQFRLLKTMSNPELQTTQRSLIAKDFIQTWKDGIVYYEKPKSVTSLTASQNTRYKKNVQTAMTMISTGTNIRFVERTNQSEYVKFQISNTNSSPLGWRVGRINTVKLYNWNRPGIIAHELMHTLGIMHEQCRADRAQYLTINYNKIKAGSEHNFNITPGYAGYGDFDFNSVMMYGAYSFSIDGTATIRRLDGNVYQHQRNNLSQGDYDGLRHLYDPSRIITEDVDLYRIETMLGVNKCLDVQYGHPKNESLIILNSNHKNNNQKFLFRKSKNHGYFILKSKLDTTKVITVRGGAKTIGTEVELNALDTNNTSAQEWKLHNLGNEGFSFAPRIAPTLRLEIKDGNTDDETKVVLGETDETKKKQRFKLSKNN